jgi:tRNA dimethylallyltransferase
LAQRFQGEIVNYDSLQLYRGFDVGTAKTPVADRQGVPHRLLDVLDPSQSFSAGEYAREARQAMESIALPILVGGTGFYLRALLDGLPALPGRDENVRARLLRREKANVGSLHRLLSRLEPSAAERIHARDVQKLIRALEIRLLTSSAPPRPESAKGIEGRRVLQIGLSPDRVRLHQILERRARAMFSGGLIEEVQALLRSGCTGEEKPFGSLGYKQALAHLRGLVTLEAAIESTIVETRQYAKRQRTWFRRDPRVQWLEGFGPDVRKDAEELIDQFLRDPPRWQ